MFQHAQSSPDPIFLNSDELLRDTQKYLSTVNHVFRAGDSSATLNARNINAFSGYLDTVDSEPSVRSHVLPDVRSLRSIAKKNDPRAEVNASPLQIWEGRVLSVDWNVGSMDVMLSAKMNTMPDNEHTGEIDLQWVAEQDHDLVRPGAVFYLTLFKRTKRGTVENSQELRFRRLPNWTRKQLDKIENEAAALLPKIKMAPCAA